jgi:hypothetical protein
MMPPSSGCASARCGNFLATLLLSQGVPMLLGGDEFSRTQGGNNNAYCQDSEISWFDWEGIDAAGRGRLAFTRTLIALRRAHMLFHRNRFFHGQTIPGTDVKDVVWLRPDGAEMGDDDWTDPHGRALAVRLSGEAGLMHLTERGEQEPDDQPPSSQVGSCGLGALSPREAVEMPPVRPSTVRTCWGRSGKETWPLPASPERVRTFHRQGPRAVAPAAGSSANRASLRIQRRLDGAVPRSEYSAYAPDRW